MLNKLATKELAPLEVIDALNSPLKKAIMEGRPKEEIMEYALRESAVSGNFKLSSNIADELAKKLLKMVTNLYKKKEPLIKEALFYEKLYIIISLKLVKI